MRTSILAMTVAFGTAIAVPALGQKSMAPVEPQMQSDKQMQEEANKGIKTRDSGESGFVGQQERPGASAHPPGQPGQTTTGSGAGTSSARGSETGASPR
jgi:hypothetical protein